jgi:hypothetical protein
LFSKIFFFFSKLLKHLHVNLYQTYLVIKENCRVDLYDRKSVYYTYALYQGVTASANPIIHDSPHPPPPPADSHTEPYTDKFVGRLAFALFFTFRKGSILVNKILKMAKVLSFIIFIPQFPYGTGLCCFLALFIMVQSHRLVFNKLIEASQSL